jgi:hypothetical protein
MAQFTINWNLILAICKKLLLKPKEEGRRKKEEGRRKKEEGKCNYRKGFSN